MSDRGGLEEERRLMYVAITRARKRLYLSHSQTRMLHGQTRYNLKSRFLEELPESALKWITPKKQTLGFEFEAFGDASVKPFGAPMAQRSAASPQGLRVGGKVFHAKFGEGTVLALEGSADDARAQINFPRHGVKWLALSVAKLTLIP